MKIIYGYSNCTNSKYREILKSTNQLVMHADQKYHSLLIEGLAKSGAEIRCISGLPINRSVSKRLFISEKDEVQDEVTYHYIKSINFPILRQICIYFASRRFVKKQCKKDEKDTFVICDCLNMANAYGMLQKAKKLRVPLVFVVTDIPEFQREGFLLGFNNRYLYNANGFIFLTKQMDDKVNPYKKPYIVLEGHSDSFLAEADDRKRYELIDEKKVIIYAGSIQKRYGIEYLVEGFILANIPNSELRIYGDGDYRGELEVLTEKYSNVKYMGIKSNEEIVSEEQKVSLLVNPRPSAPEYTKYSFPSKNMEYMVSGTPVLTTKLPGMPEEYHRYVYLLEDETPMGVSDSLREIFSLSFEERNKKGAAARKFVLENKSSVIQAKKIIDFLKEVKVWPKNI